MSCRNFNRGVEIYHPVSTPWRDGAAPRLGNWEAVLLKAPKMYFDGPSDSAKCRIDGLAGGDAPRKIRHRGAPIAAAITIDLYQILQPLHFSPLSPACLFTEAKVPFGMSSPKAPLTVTRPGLVGCLNWR